jgi:biopolymer transport protein ExbB
MLEMIQKNWVHMGPILGVGFVAVLLILDRFRVLFIKFSFNSSNSFFEQLRSMLHDNRHSEALALCDRYRDKPVAMVAKEGLLRMQQPEEIVQHGLEIAVSEAISQVQKRTNYIATIANVATLLGLFGTILGMIHSFEAIGSASAQQRSALLAAGISTAMNATLMGLAVAIPCMLFYSFFAAKTNRLIAQIEQSAVRTLDLIKQKYYGAQSATVHSTPVKRKVA